MTLRRGQRLSAGGLAASYQATSNPRQRCRVETSTRRVETSMLVPRPQWRPTPLRHTPLVSLSPQTPTIDQTIRTGLQLQRLMSCVAATISAMQSSSVFSENSAGTTSNNKLRSNNNLQSSCTGWSRCYYTQAANVLTTFGRRHLLYARAPPGRRWPRAAVAVANVRAATM
jgi:hypothetical protein